MEIPEAWIPTIKTHNLIYVNDFHNCSKLLDFHLFADDANLFFQHKDINMLESLINSELEKVFNWLCAD